MCLFVELGPLREEVASTAQKYSVSVKNSFSLLNSLEFLLTSEVSSSFLLSNEKTLRVLREHVGPRSLHKVRGAGDSVKPCLLVSVYTMR